MTVIIDGTNGVTSVNGTAAAPSVTGADTDTGIVYGTNTLSLSTGGTTAVTVDSSQNVGIGTASPAQKLTVAGTIQSTSGGFKFPDNTTQTTAASVSTYAGANAQFFTSGTSTFTIPAGVTAVKVTVVGGGGGGSNSAANPGVSCGGGAGGAAIKYLTGLTPGATLSVSVGGAGGAGASGGTSSVSSGTQTISTISATGGASSAAPGTSTWTGNAGGVGSGGDINITGGFGVVTGGTSIPCVAQRYYGGTGGSVGQSAFLQPQSRNIASPTIGMFGGYGGYSTFVTSGGATGQAATGYGNGGQGGAAVNTTSTGGSGAGGVVFFEW